MHVRIRTSVCFFLTVLFALTSVLCVSPKKACAKTDPANPDLVPDKVVVYDNGDVFSSFGGTVKDTETAAKALKSSSQVTMSPDSFSTYLEGFKSLPCGNGDVNVDFYSTFEYNLGYTQVTLTQGASDTLWTGTVPQVNATHASLSDSVTWNSLGSVSISTGGVGWSVQSHTASWTSGQVSNCWKLNHSFGGLMGTGVITSVVESSTGDFYFQTTNTFVTPTAFDQLYS